MKFLKIFAAQILIILTFLLPLFTNAQNKMEVEFKTGEDDLAVRDASIQGNLKITVNYKDGTTPNVLANANKNQSWPKNSIRRVSIPLAATADINNFSSIEISRSTTNTNLEDAVADNWDLVSLIVTVTMKKGTVTSKYQLLTKTGTPLNRFKGGKNCDCYKTYSFSAPLLTSGTTTWIDKFAPEQKTSIIADFGNGGDDLRGGNDNVRIVILFKNSTRTLSFSNLNKGANWGNFTEKTVAPNSIPSIPNLKISGVFVEKTEFVTALDFVFSDSVKLPVLPVVALTKNP